MLKFRVAALSLALLASPAAAQSGDAWKAANQAMGEALKAGDATRASRHALEALKAYQSTKEPAEKTLLHLALNLADVTLQAPVSNKEAISALKSVISDLAKKGSSTALSRIYLYNALVELAKPEGQWTDVRGYLGSIIAMSREAYGPYHPQVAYAQISLARHFQMMGTTGPAATTLRDAETITEAQPENSLDRLNLERAIAMYHIEGKRHSEALKRLEFVVARLSPDNAKQAQLWTAAMGNLAATQARMGDRAKADSTVADLIARTKENNEAQALIAWLPYDDTHRDLRQYSNRVEVTYDVGADGHTRNIRTEILEGNPQFGAFVAKAVEGWRYLPVIKNGAPQPSADLTTVIGSQSEREAPTGSRLK